MSATSLFVPVVGILILCLALARRDTAVPATPAPSAAGAADRPDTASPNASADSSAPTPPSRLTHPPDRPAP
jgi:hypothetical protein